MSHGTCHRCQRPFTPRSTGGKAQRFCSERCRRAFERELRAWARNQIAAGGVTPARLQRARSLGAPSLGSEAKYPRSCAVAQGQRARCPKGNQESEQGTE